MNKPGAKKKSSKSWEKDTLDSSREPIMWSSSSTASLFGTDSQLSWPNFPKAAPKEFLAKPTLRVLLCGDDGQLENVGCSRQPLAGSQDAGEVADGAAKPLLHVAEKKRRVARAEPAKCPGSHDWWLTVLCKCGEKGS